MKRGGGSQDETRRDEAACWELSRGLAIHGMEGQSVCLSVGGGWVVVVRSMWSVCTVALSTYLVRTWPVVASLLRSCSTGRTWMRYGGGCR